MTAYERSYYQDDIYKFLQTSHDEILGRLADNNDFALELSQKNAWNHQIVNLKEQLTGMDRGKIFFEFLIPRMGKRVDVLLFIDNVIFVLEYKVGSDSYDRHAMEQALDYALDLKNFHEGSHRKYIVPILVSTRAGKRDNMISWYGDNIARPLFCNGSDLVDMIEWVLCDIKGGLSGSCGLDNLGDGFDAESWAASGYKPTPTIIEAAQALYQKHDVKEISRSDLGVKNLAATSDCISRIIKYSKVNGRKSICFVTGVPGAGKTLAGLNIANCQFDKDSKEHAVFLSGNGPLVSVLREALARDDIARAKLEGVRISKREATQKVSKFIQNIHHFRDEGLGHSGKVPSEHVVIFDEAQRAWNQSHVKKFMAQKRGIPEFSMSEPEFLISLMNRREDWCTIICLIGGGQEINTGEAGLVEWFNALGKSFSDWDIYHSGQLSNSNYNWGEDLAGKLDSLNSVEEVDLHLSVSIRSFRAEKLSDFIGSVIDGDDILAREIFSELDNYPVVITRDINKAKGWLKNQTRGSERSGKVASSGGVRLKAEGVYVKDSIEPCSWFLNGKEDIRSSYYYENVATEFDIQGLELDWTCVCWDADFRMENEQWGYYSFKGTRWQNIRNSYKRVYLANAYRVLLTRARQGMVIFIPYGSDEDYTRLQKFYDGTYKFLKRCGLKEIL